MVNENPALALETDTPDSENPGHRGPNPSPDNFRDWIANVTLGKFSLGGSGSVMFFLGPVSQIPEDVSEWDTSPICVGGYDIFANNNPESCKNCKELQAKNIQVGGTVFLTEALIAHEIPLVGHRPEQYLTENLNWRCKNTRNVEVPLGGIPSLEVVVQSAGYQLTPGGDRPHRTQWVIHAGVTRGKLGGIKEDE
jgi:tyrosinase